MLGICYHWWYADSGNNGKPFKAPAVEEAVATPAVGDRWYYPPELANDLQDVNIPEAVKEEVFACAWEYTRCVIPQYTNWPRYVAFMRIIVMGIIAEFRGSLVDVAAGDDILGYDLGATLDALFLGTPGQYVEQAHFSPTAFPPQPVLTFMVVIVKLCPASTARFC